MTRTRRAVHGLTSDIGGHGLLIVTNFVAVPIILGYLSQAEYGFWLSLLSLLGFLGLVEFGIGIAISRRIAEIGHTGDRDALRRVVTTGAAVMAVCALVLLAVGLAVLPFASTWFGMPSGMQKDLMLMGQIVVIGSAIALPLAPFGAIVIGYQRLATHNNISNGLTIAGILASLTILWAGGGIVALAVGHAATVLSIGLVNLWFAKRICPWPLVRPSAFDRSELRKLVHFGGYFQLGRMANTVALNADNIVISVFLGAASVTPYNLTARLATLFSVTLASKIPVAIMPGATEAFAMGQVDRLRIVMIRLTGYATRLTVIGTLVVATLNETFVTLWVGAENFGGLWLTAAFVSWVMIDTVYRGTMGILYATGNIRNWALCALGEAVLNVVVSLILVGPFGLVGVAAGTTLAKILTTGWYGLYLIARTLSLPIRQLLLEGIVVPAIRSAPGALVVMGLVWSGWIGASWSGIAIVTTTAFICNIAAFEGWEISRSSSLSLRERIQALVR